MVILDSQAAPGCCTGICHGMLTSPHTSVLRMPCPVIPETKVLVLATLNHLCTVSPVIKLSFTGLRGKVSPLSLVRGHLQASYPV